MSLISHPKGQPIQGVGVSVSVTSVDGVDVSVDVGGGVSVTVGEGVLVGVNDGVWVGVIVGVNVLVGVDVNVTTGRLIGPVNSSGISRSRRIQPPSYCCISGSV